MAEKWSSAVQFPTDSNFVNRIISAEFGESKSSGNPMITLVCEVVAPQEAEVGGKVYNIAGVKTTNYFTTKNLNDGEKSEAAQGRLREFLGLLFPDKQKEVEAFNFENPDPALLKELEGKLVLTQMSPETRERRKNPTAAQIEEAKKSGKRAEGDVMKHPVTGKDLIMYVPKINEFYGLAPESIISADAGGVKY